LLNPQSISTENNLACGAGKPVIVCNKYLNHVVGNPGCGGFAIDVCAGGKQYWLTHRNTPAPACALIIVHKTFRQPKERIKSGF
jgi:hypothetical protein